MEGHDEAEQDGEETHTFLYTDLIGNCSVLELDCLPPKLDHCDLLVDAIDAQLDQLQLQLPKSAGAFGEHDCNNAAIPGWNRSLSGVTDLGSTTINDSPLSCHDLKNTSMSESMTGCLDGPKETKMRLDRRRNEKEETQSRRQQVIWRLERLLGDTCKDRDIAEETEPPSDSICTEDFFNRFREEMLVLPDTMQQPAEEEKETADSSQNAASAEGGGSEAAESSRTATETSDHSQSIYPGQRMQQRKRLSDDRGNMFLGREETEAAERRKAQQKPAYINSGWQPVPHLIDHSTDQSDSETPSQGDSEPQPTIVRSPCCGHSQNSKFPEHKLNSSRRETCRLNCCPVEYKETDKKVKHWRGTSGTVRTSEKMQSDVIQMKDRLFNLRTKCEEEEDTLQLRKIQLKDVKRCLSELRQKRRHAMQQAERLAAEIALMEKEKKTLESCLTDSRAERDSARCQLQTLQRQRESYLLEIRDIKKELAMLCQHKQYLEDGSCFNKMNSVLRREEVECQCKLLVQQQLAREQMESLQERLEETHDELHRSREAESSLRNVCAALEDAHRQKKERTELLELQVSELQRDLRRCKFRVETLDQVMSQKELQLLHLQQHCEELQKERDELKGELQHMKNRLYEELREAEEQAQTTMEHKTPEEERRRCEAEIMQIHCGIQEGQSRGSLESLTGQMNESLALQHQVVELKTRVSVLEQESGAQQRELPPSLTVADALAQLGTVRGQLKLCVNRLQQELDSQKQTNEQLRKDQEQELNAQRLQLTVERDRALDSLRERLIQEHIEELSSFKRARTSDGGSDVGSDGGGAVASLHRQLQDKDLELRRLQTGMAQWKQRTAAHLACTFEEELTAELERCKSQLMRGRKESRTQDARLKRDPKEALCSLSAHAVNSTAHIPSDVASYKLLRHLQSRVKQLRVEMLALMWSPPPPDVTPLDLSGSPVRAAGGFHQKQICQGGDVAGILNQPSK